MEEDQAGKDLTPGEILVRRNHCQTFSRMGWALFLQMFSGVLLATLILVVVMQIAPEYAQNVYFNWGVTLVANYLVSFPLFCLVISTVPARPPLCKTLLGPGKFLQVYCMGVAALYLFNLISLALTQVLGRLRGTPVVNPVDNMMDLPLSLSVLMVCVLAPVAEEIMFRGLLLNRLRPYGERFAVLASALAFALMHGNFSQMFYAFGVGLLLGYVALKTGHVWQTILLHSMLNAISVALVPLMDHLGEWGNLVGGLLILVTVVLGVVFFVRVRRKLQWKQGTLPFREATKWRLFFENPGMAVFCLGVGLAVFASLL